MLSNDCRRLVEWKRRVVRRQAVQYRWIINDGSLARYTEERSKEEVVRNGRIGIGRAPFPDQGNRLRHEGLLVCWWRFLTRFIVQPPTPRVILSASSFYSSRYPCWQEIQVDTNRKVSLDSTRLLLFTPCFHTYIRSVKV